MIQDHPRWFQGGSGSFHDHQSSTKNVSIWRFDDVQKTPPRSHMNPQNHPKIHKSLVLAHNIHKDCLLGVAKGFSHDIWCEALSSSMVHGGPEGWFLRSRAKGCIVNFGDLVLSTVITPVKTRFSYFRYESKVQENIILPPRGLNEIPARSQTWQKWRQKLRKLSKFQKHQKWSRMILDESRKVQKVFLATRAQLKR